jgi:hypothetical protein
LQQPAAVPQKKKVCAYIIMIILVSGVPPQKTETGRRHRVRMPILVATQIHRIRRRLRNPRRSRPRVAPNLERLETKAKMTELVEGTGMVMKKRKRRR